MAYKAPEIKPSHKGLLHQDLGVPEGKKLTLSDINKAMHSPSPAVRKRANFAKVTRKWNK